MKTLRGRIGLALLVFGLTTLLAVGGSLWVALRDLHRDASLGALTELTLPYARIVRERIPGTVLRPSADTRRPTPGFVERFRQGRLSGTDEAVNAFLDQFDEDIDPTRFSLILIQGSTALVANPVEGTADTLTVVPDIESNLLRGQITTGVTDIEGIGQVIYAATPIQEARGARDVPLIVLARADDSAQLATQDLARALALAAVALLVLGVPIAAGLSSSITRPLRRLAMATETVAAGAVPEPLPTTGPTEVAQASAAFNAMAAEVDATRQTQRQLLADIRHDLRTPLTVIGGFAEALQDGTATGHAAIRAAHAISDETGRLGRMLDDLDHLTVPGVAGPPLRQETLDSRSVASEAIARFEAEATSREQSVRLDPGVASIELVSDRDALDRILGNILANALSHAPSPGGQVRLEVTEIAPLGSTPRSVEFAVQDDGPGIPAAALPHVFDRFYRADPSRANRGSGLGLAIVRDLAGSLGGNAFAENPRAGGARVGVRLPATPPASETSSVTTHRGGTVGQ